MDIGFKKGEVCCDFVLLKRDIEREKMVFFIFVFYFGWNTCQEIIGEFANLKIKDEFPSFKCHDLSVTFVFFLFFILFF